MQNERTEVVDNLIVGLGAAGIATAKLLGISNPNDVNLVLEHHFEPGGCSGYFARGFPRRIFDVGATQLIECEENGLQSKLFYLNNRNSISKLKTHKIDCITFHLPEHNLKLALKADGEIEIIEGQIDKNELRNLIRFFKYANKNSTYLWKLLGKVPKFPMLTKREIYENFSLFVSINFSIKIKLLLTILLKTSTCASLFGIKNHHVISKSIINSLLMDTSQTNMQNTPWIVGCMGLSILHKGIYRLEGGMRSYFKPMASHILKNKIRILYAQEVKEVFHFDEGYFIKSVDKNNIQKNYLVKYNLFMNTTIWNTVKLFQEDKYLYNHVVFKKWREKSQQEKGWGALALYGYFNDNPSFPREPWYHQLFPLTNEAKEIHSPLYLSIYQADISSKIRCFTATLHIEISSYNIANKEKIIEFLSRRIEESIKTKLIKCELANPFTYEKYTLRSKGQVGGLIATFNNFFFNPTPSFLNHYNNKSKLFLIGDTVFPGQGVISSTISGIIAWERATGNKFNSFIKDFH